MIRAHQPGSQPIDIPEVIPNPAVVPKQEPAPKEPVRVPEKVPADRLRDQKCGRRFRPFAMLNLHGWGEKQKVRIWMKPLPRPQFARSAGRCSDEQATSTEAIRSRHIHGGV
jgi:hypothetical protein